jgi:hypothetical protein
LRGAWGLPAGIPCNKTGEAAGIAGPRRHGRGGRSSGNGSGRPLGRAIDLLAKDWMPDFPELADEAFADRLRKHNRPTDLRTALRESAADMEKRPPPPAASVKRGGGRKAAGNDNDR